MGIKERLKFSGIQRIVGHNPDGTPIVSSMTRGQACENFKTILTME
jgi:hypothetical protein